MPTYIPVFQKKVDPVTGQELLDENGVPIMEHVRDIIVPDPPIYEPTPEELAIMLEMEQSQSIQESPTEPDPTQNP